MGTIEHIGILDLLTFLGYPLNSKIISYNSGLKITPLDGVTLLISEEEKALLSNRPLSHGLSFDNCYILVKRLDTYFIVRYNELTQLKKDGLTSCSVLMKSNDIGLLMYELEQLKK